MDLLSRLPSFPESATVFEIGCGTGETARMLLESSMCRYIGLDASGDMLVVARKALSSFKDRIRLLQHDLTAGPIPLHAGSVDAIIAESTLAIIDAPGIMEECRRVLKPGGLLAWNDRLWASGQDAPTRKMLNEVSERVCGFPAATLSPGTASGWRSEVEKTGFKVVVMMRLTRSAKRDTPRRTAIRNAARLLARPIGIGQTVQLMRERMMARKFRHEWERMESWLFVARKP